MSLVCSTTRCNCSNRNCAAIKSRSFVATKRTRREAYGNAGKLQQVFTNLILNARDAIPDGGRIIVSTGTAEDGSLFAEISDTGIGIAPENVAKIYDPFYTTKGVGQGTGLGLAVSYGIVQEHAGRISVESTPGRAQPSASLLPTARARARLQAVGD